MALYGTVLVCLQKIHLAQSAIHATLDLPSTRGNIMDQNIRSSLQTSTFYFFLISVVLVTIAQLTTMSVIVTNDISGKEAVVAASVIGPALIGAFGIMRIMTNMEYCLTSAPMGPNSRIC